MRPEILSNVIRILILSSWKLFQTAIRFFACSEFIHSQWDCTCACVVACTMERKERQKKRDNSTTSHHHHTHAVSVFVCVCGQQESIDLRPVA